MYVVLGARISFCILGLGRWWFVKAVQCIFGDELSLGDTAYTFEIAKNIN